MTYTLSHEDALYALSFMRMTREYNPNGRDTAECPSCHAFAFIPYKEDYAADYGIKHHDTCSIVAARKTLDELRDGKDS